MSGIQEKLIPVANVAALGLGVGRRTIGRRIKVRSSGFPPVVRVNGRLFVTQSELEQYKAKLIATGGAMRDGGHTKAESAQVAAE